MRTGLIAAAIALFAIIAGFPDKSAQAESNTVCPEAITKYYSPNRPNTGLAFGVILNRYFNSPKKTPEAAACIDFYISAGADVNRPLQESEQTFEEQRVPPLLLSTHPHIARLLLSRGADPHYVSPLGRSILSVAVKWWPLEEIKFWQQVSGLDPKNQKESDRDFQAATLLHLSLRNENTKVLPYLIDQGISVHATDAHGRTALSSAHREEDIRFLISKGSDMNMRDKKGITPLANQILHGANTKIARLFLDHELDVPATERAMATDKKSFYKGLLPFMIFNDEANPQFIRSLLEKGANPDAILADQGTPALHLAIEKENTEVVNLLLDRGVPVDQADKTGATGLHFAVARSNPDLVRLMLRRGANVNRNSYLWDYPIHNAKDFASVKALVDQGADLNVKDSKDRTPLMRKVQKDCDLKSVQYFLKNGASQEDAKELLFHSAQNRECDKEVMSLFMSSGTPIDTRNKDGETPLFAALAAGNLDKALILIRNGANPYIRNNDGKSALQFTQSYLNLDIHQKVEKFLRDIRKKSLSDLWDGWAKDPNSQAQPKLEELKEALLVKLETHGATLAIPKHAPDAIKQAFVHLNTATATPWELTEKSLDERDMPASYYRRLLKAAQTREAIASRKFNPSPEQTKQVLKAMVADGFASASDYDSMAWLIAKSGMPLEPGLLDFFNFSENQLKEDVAAMVASDPLKFKNSPNVAAIKLAKVLLLHEDEDFKCAASSSKDSPPIVKNRDIANILHWFAIYGDNFAADKVFLARLARLILEKKQICEPDRNFLLRAMNNWGHAVAQAHHDAACSILSSASVIPMEKKKFEELLLISQIIGLRSDLSFGSWLEQIRVSSDLDANSKAAFGPLAEQLYLGLLRYTLGNPECSQTTNNIKFKIPKASGHPGSIVKLCRQIEHWIANPNSSAETDAQINAGKKWVATLKNGLQAPRIWPRGITCDQSEQKATSLAAEFEAAGLAEDLEAIQSGCSQLPPLPSSQAPTNTTVTPIRAPVIKKPARPAGKDFDPRGRR